jgi:hypothetical protein
LRTRKLQEQAAIARNALSGLKTGDDLRFAVTALAQLYWSSCELVLRHSHLNKRLILGVA